MTYETAKIESGKRSALKIAGLTALAASVLAAAFNGDCIKGAREFVSKPYDAITRAISGDNYESNQDGERRYE